MNSKFYLQPIVRGLKPIAPILYLLEDLNAFICGGYARYCASPNTGDRLTKAGDVDIYCYDEQTYDYIKKLFL